MVRKSLLIMAAAVSAAGANAQSAEAARLDLVCLGSGSANRNSTIFSGGESATILGNRSVPFEDQVNLWVEGEEGRIRLPAIMLPPIRGGENGWFRLTNLKVNEDEITGSVALNPLNRPKLRIDRITGAISVSSRLSGDYSGRCTRYDPQTVERAF